MTNSPVTPAELHNHIEALNEMIKANTVSKFGEEFFANHGRVVVLDPRGRKYRRVIVQSHSGGQRSVHHFVEVATGNILMAASWKGPAKHPRGNIRSGLEGVGVYGADYLR